MRVPHSVAMMFALWDQTITGKLRGREPRATVEAVRMGKKMMFVSSAKAERDWASAWSRSMPLCGRPSIGFGRMGTRPRHETHRDYRGHARRIKAAGAGMEALRCGRGSGMAGHA